MGYIEDTWSVSKTQQSNFNQFLYFSPHISIGILYFSARK